MWCSAALGSTPSAGFGVEREVTSPKQEHKILFVDSETEDPVDVQLELEYTTRFDEVRYAVEAESSDGLAVIEVPEFVTFEFALARPAVAGYWNTYRRGSEFLYDVDDGVVACTPLPNLDSPWWIALLGLNAEGESVRRTRIGVVDTEFDPGPNSWGHGEAIRSLVLDATDGHEVEVQCFEVGKGAVTTEQIVTGLFRALDADVDLVSLSYGVYLDEVDQEDLEPLRDLLAVLWDTGILCVAAGGNREGEAAFPAVAKQCVAVAAIGMLGWAPPGSAAHEYQIRAQNRGCLGRVEGERVFAWTDSCVGDVCAPGVGLVFSRANAPAYAVSGTSFAAPLAAATLAVELSRTARPERKTRSQAYLDKLHSMCLDCRLGEFQGSGIPKVSQ